MWQAKQRQNAVLPLKSGFNPSVIVLLQNRIKIIEDNAIAEKCLLTALHRQDTLTSGQTCKLTGDMQIDRMTQGLWAVFGVFQTLYIV